MNVPKELKYHAEHTWAKVEGDTATVGITDYAQDQLGEIVYLELPAAGKTVEAGKAFAEIESVKSVSDVYSPVSGEIVEANKGALDAPEIINEDCYGAGWLIKVKMAGVSGVDALLDAAAYEGIISE